MARKILPHRTCGSDAELTECMGYYGVVCTKCKTGENSWTCWYNYDSDRDCIDTVIRYWNRKQLGIDEIIHPCRLTWNDTVSVYMGDVDFINRLFDDGRISEDGRDILLVYAECCKGEWDNGREEV